MGHVKLLYNRLELHQFSFGDHGVGYLQVGQLFDLPTSKHFRVHLSPNERNLY